MQSATRRRATRLERDRNARGARSGHYEPRPPAPGLEEWTSKVVIPKGPVVVQVTVPELEPGRRGPPPPVVKPEARRKRGQARSEILRSERRLQTGAVILGSAGIACAGGAATFGIQYPDEQLGRARAVCPAEPMFHRGGVPRTSLVEDAKKARTLTYIERGRWHRAARDRALPRTLNSAEDPSLTCQRPRVPHVAHDGNVGAGLLGLLMRLSRLSRRRIAVLAVPGSRSPFGVSGR